MQGILNAAGDSSSDQGVSKAGLSTTKKKKGKKVWSRKKLKTGRRLLLQMGCTLTAPASDPGSEQDS